MTKTKKIVCIALALLMIAERNLREYLGAPPYISEMDDDEAPSGPEAREEDDFAGSGENDDFFLDDEESDGNEDEEAFVEIEENDDFFSVRYEDDKFKDKVKRNTLCLEQVKYNGRTNNIFYQGEKMLLELNWTNLEDVNELNLRIEVYDYRRYPITSFLAENVYSGKAGECGDLRLSIDVDQLAQGVYYTRYIFTQKLDPDGEPETVEAAAGLVFRKTRREVGDQKWKKSWGSVIMGKAEVIEN